MTDEQVLGEPEYDEGLVESLLANGEHEVVGPGRQLQSRVARSETVARLARMAQSQHAALLSERAAREEAEKQSAVWKAWADDWKQQFDAAEAERDALALENKRLREGDFEAGCASCNEIFQTATYDNAAKWMIDNHSGHEGVRLIVAYPEPFFAAITWWAAL